MYNCALRKFSIWTYWNSAVKYKAFMRLHCITYKLGWLEKVGQWKHEILLQYPSSRCFSSFYSMQDWILVFPELIHIHLQSLSLNNHAPFLISIIHFILLFIPFERESRSGQKDHSYFIIAPRVAIKLQLSISWIMKMWRGMKKLTEFRHIPIPELPEIANKLRQCPLPNFFAFFA